MHSPKKINWIILPGKIKAVSVIFCLFILLSTPAFSQWKKKKVQEPDKFNISIKEWGMIFENNFRIHGDSVKISLKGKNPEKRFVKILSEKEKESIIAHLKRISWKEIKRTYVNDQAPDDLAEYDFSIAFNKEVREFHIYQVAVEDMIALVQVINVLLPSEFRISYDDNYVKKK
jgi:hypothetical protein